MKFTKKQLKEAIKEVMMEMNYAKYGAIDARDGNPPSKIGQGNEEYMAAYNAELVKQGKEPLPIVAPSQAYLDALHSGKLEELNKEDSRQERWQIVKAWDALRKMVQQSDKLSTEHRKSLHQAAKIIKGVADALHEDL